MEYGLMTKADKYLIESIYDILQNGTKDVNPRPKYKDGTPAHTYFVTHQMRQYDLTDGEFPICTLRPIAWKTGIREIFAIYQNQSNKVSEFERLGCGWWKDWMLDDGTIGKSYPYNIESHRPDEEKRMVKKIPRKIIPKDEGYIHDDDIPKFKKEESEYENDNVILNRYRVLGLDKELSDEKHKYYRIQFVSNNYISSIRKDSIGVSNGTNPYDRTVYEIGYLDKYKDNLNFAEWELKELKRKWENMFFRCYSERFEKLYPTYNDKFVHHRWHSFANFLKDVRYIPQYFLAREDHFKGWDLDKDYYGSNAYSKDTCVFLKHDENTLYALTKGCYRITDKNTKEVCYEINITDFAKKIGARQTVLQKSISRSNKYKNFIFEHVDNDNQYVYRYELSRNQLNELINNIKTNPNGRRHIISFWNWANINEKALVECAYETIWTVRGEYLDMFLNQRSGDLLTASGAGGINEVQYAALLMMIAQCTGYKPGKFTHFVVNEHLYDHHIDQAKELIHRANERHMTTFEALKNGRIDTNITPKLVLNPDKKDFYDMTIDDFSMENYTPMRPNLVLELGI